ncbi:uncharacterized protein G2W53_012232 [Senna tora]|uniref:Uncharacterized protein n=1 Tax=Senna tora TaxID=362788 RepID=A0A834TXS0_9FABA|nr:uncharacterized protein G2W53_012232 [Senna tora]
MRCNTEEKKMPKRELRKQNSTAAVLVLGRYPFADLELLKRQEMKGIFGSKAIVV